MTRPGLYRHHKGGLYQVLFVAHESTNAREGGNVVVYLSLATGRINVRDELEFHERVAIEAPAGIVHVGRFEEQQP